MGSAEIASVLEFVGPYLDFADGFLGAFLDIFDAATFFVGSLGEAGALPTL